MTRFYLSKGKDPNLYIPETFVVKLDHDYKNNEQFTKFTKQVAPGELWIYKPGESSNRGNGIFVLNSINAIKKHIQSELKAAPYRYQNFILQRYITKPFLIRQRKFDIRVFALFTGHSETGFLRGYLFEEGYLRTCSKEFDLSQWENRFVHLTNDAIQKHSADYGKFESSNKLSYADFEAILLKERKISFTKEIKPLIAERVADIFEAVGSKLYLNGEG